MSVKGILTEDFLENYAGRLSNNSRRGAHELFRRVIQQIRLEGLSNKFDRNSVESFREQKDFILKTVFLLSFGLGMCEGVSEDSRHGIGHANIQVGSCIYLSVIVCHDMCT